MLYGLDHETLPPSLISSFFLQSGLFMRETVQTDCAVSLYSHSVGISAGGNNVTSDRIL